VTHDRWVCFQLLTFTDGSAQAQLLAEGTQEECKRTRDLIDAVSYSGEKQIADVAMYAMPDAEFRKALAAAGMAELREMGGDL
jgi:hypothetical protein